VRAAFFKEYSIYNGAMRYLGIDYGSKRVGVALSDEGNTFALPHSVIQNSEELVEDLRKIIHENKVGHIILGESKNFKGEDNKIMKDIRNFKEDLENTLNMPVIFEPEFLTSHEAEHIQGKNDMHDASAAALILKSYLERIKNI
jgi:putative Holliday junction resolvase